MTAARRRRPAAWIAGLAAFGLGLATMTAVAVVAPAPVSAETTVGAGAAAVEGGSRLRDEGARMTSISGEYYHACAVTSTGAVHCWGANGWGQAPAADLPGPYILVTTGDYHSCGLLATGALHCWGNNAFGQAPPVDLPGPFTSVSAALDATCVLTAAGAVHCFGDNKFGAAPPIDQPGPFTSISIGSRAGCSLKPNGGVHCWGDNTYSQVPAVDLAGPYQQVSMGEHHVCGLLASGSVHCWGANNFGQALDQAGPFRSVSAGGYHTCAVRVTGVMHCWGDNTNSAAPAADQAGPFIAVSGSYDSTCAITANGALDCWGVNTYGQAPNVDSSHVYAQPSVSVNMSACSVQGDGTLWCWGSNTVGQAPAGPSATLYLSASMGESHGCGLLPTGAVHCWGSNTNGQAPAADQPGPFVAVSAGASHTCAIRATGAVHCWGSNAYGQAPVVDQAGPFISVSAGYRHSCGVLATGTMHCWGDDTWLQRGNDQVGPFASVNAGYFHSCGVLTTGAVHCWGINSLLLGPTDVAGPFGGVSAGYHHSCGVLATGAIHCGGDNSYGAAPPADQPGPFLSVGAGWDVTCGMRATGVVSCWGWEAGGVLGSAPHIDRLPVARAHGWYDATVLTGTPRPDTLISGVLTPGVTYSNGRFSGPTGDPATGSGTLSAWNPFGSVTANLTLAVRDFLTVSAPSATVVVGMPITALSPTYSGWTGTDDASVLTTPATCTTTATQESGPGTYPVTCSGAVAPGTYHLDYVPGKLVVTKAASTTEVTVADGVARATVRAAAPGRGTPTGLVGFARNGTPIGTATLNAQGVATFSGIAMPAGDVTVMASYTGDPKFTSSLGTTAKKDPKITWHTSTAANAGGWFDAPATVVFACTAGSARLTAPCPEPVTLGPGAGQVLSRTITAIDGGAAGVTTVPINVDPDAPALSVKGIKAGQRLSGPPVAPITCAASDALSGLAHPCELALVKVTAARSPAWTATWRYTATVADLAGHAATITGTYTVGSFHIDGLVAAANGTVPLKAGRKYTFRAEVATKKAPTFYKARPAGARRTAVPTVVGPRMARSANGSWSVRITFTAAQKRASRYWNVGLRLPGEKKTRLVTFDLGR